MSKHYTTSSSLRDAILQSMRPSGIYTVQHLALRLRSLSPTNSQIRAALDRLITEGKVEVSGFFMRSANYRLSSHSVAEHRGELTGYTDSLALGAELSNLTGRK
jgi:DNA-binding transcriptional regulator PaaX